MRMIFKKAIFVTIFVLSFFFIATAHSQTMNNTISWTASWIWQETDGPENTWMCFRKSFNLTNVPAIVMANIAVDSKYWMYINNELVVFEGGLNRGPTRTTGYFDEIAIRPYLMEGENTIAILVWYWGNEGRNNLDSGKGGLLFQADMGALTLTSNSSWKMKLHPAYGFVPFKPNAEGTLYLYGGWNIGFDARNDMPGWYLKEYDDSLWFTPTEKGIPPAAPWNELWKRPIPQWKNYGLQDYTNAALLSDVSDGNLITAKLPYNAQVTPYLKIDAPPGLKIKIETDRYEVNGYYGHRTEYITRDGVQEFESLAWQNGECVFYDIPAGVKILELKYRETGYATEFAGSFKCNDDFYNLLFKKAVRTLYVCMRDNYMDCPDRERGQWIGDAAAMVPQTFYALDRNVDKLTLKCMREFINWQQNNLLRGLVPGKHEDELAAQSLCAISNLGIMMTYYMNTGDLTSITQSYNAIKLYLDEWSIKEGGRINLRSRWNGQGWYIDDELIETTWYYMALKSALIMAKLTDNTNDIADIQTKLDTIANNFDQNFWQGDAYRTKSFSDDRANGLVLLSGLASEDKWDVIISVLKNVKNARAFMEGYILEALFRIGNEDYALERIKERYAPMVSDSNCTTLWETFKSGPGYSTNHGWTGAPMTSLFRYVAGVRPVEPGYDTYSVLPQLGQLTNVTVIVPSIKGDINVSIDKEELRDTINLKSPDGTTAIVGIPKNAFMQEAASAIEANNIIIWKKASYKGGVVGISWNGEDDRYYKFNVIPGAFTIIGLADPLSINEHEKPVSHTSAENFPNPFNAQTRIRIKIPMAGQTIVRVYNLSGNEVCTLLDKYLTKTEHLIIWNGRDNQGSPVASGVYLYQVRFGNQKISKKMLLIK